jgi:hypothetical protein
MFDPTILVACSGLVLYMLLDNYRQATTHAAFKP